MIKKICHFLILSITSLFFSVSPALASVLYFTPVGGTITPNKTFTVQVHLKTTDPEKVTSTSVYFNYPSDKIDIVSVKAGTSFPVNLGNTYGNGVFAMTRNNANGVSGDVVVASIGIKPKVVNTPVTLTFVDGIQALQSDNTETLDAAWTKADVATFNIGDGVISTGSAKAAGGAGGDELPVAGLMDNTLVLLGFGGGLVFLSGVGLIGSKRWNDNKNRV